MRKHTKITKKQDSHKILCGVVNNEAEQCPYCGSYVAPITNKAIIKALEKSSEVAVCPCMEFIWYDKDNKLYCSNCNELKV